jgi:hypothetical protein
MVIGHGTIIIANIRGYKAIGQWRLIPALIGFRVIGLPTEEVIAG